jgi:hypothetical protein
MLEKKDFEYIVTKKGASHCKQTHTTGKWYHVIYWGIYKRRTSYIAKEKKVIIFFWIRRCRRL